MDMFKESMAGLLDKPGAENLRPDSPEVFALRDRLLAAVPEGVQKALFFAALQELLLAAVEVPDGIKMESYQGLATRVMTVLISQVNGKVVQSQDVLKALTVCLGFILAIVVKDGKEQDALGTTFGMVLESYERQLRFVNKSAFAPGGAPAGAFEDTADEPTLH